MLIPLLAIGIVALELLIAPDAHSLGLTILGVGGTLIAWLISRQIGQLDKAIDEFKKNDEMHESRLNRHGKNIARLLAWTKVPGTEKFE